MSDDNKSSLANLDYHMDQSDYPIKKNLSSTDLADYGVIDKSSIISKENDLHTADRDNYDDDDDDDDIIDSLHIMKTQSVKLGPNTTDSPPYSRFGRTEKSLLIIQCAFTGFFSSVAGAIYYPVLTVIEKKFNITEELVNITVVVYFIFQGLAPSFMGGLADSLGRRPVVLFSILVYCCACIGLALSQNYTQIVVLRCLQAAGISPVIAINSGICGDITTRAERGAYVGYVSGFIVIGSAFGALIGAGLSSTWGWRSIFWFLTIGSGICLMISIIVLPETKRTLVGNGSIRPRPYVNRAPILSLPYLKNKLHLDNPEYETLEPKSPLNLFAPFKVLKVPEIAILLIVSGLQFSMWTTHQTALSTVLSKDYGLSVAKIGLCFLPAGVCTLISVISCGRYLNWSYKKKYARYKIWLEERKKELLEEYKDPEKVHDIINNNHYYTFNICKARLQPAFVTLLISSCGFCAYGWCIKSKAPLAAVLVTSGIASLFSNCILTMSTTLCVDLFPSIASTATGCLNLTRCLLSALFIGVLSRMEQSMTYGGVFTFMAGITGLSSFLLLIPVRNGKKLSYLRTKQEALLRN
ncbi:hypothetical protein Kpol_1003p11 [Vanderwaltozyma polyspora DSM 70294]|uniref:Major facilitator superfamily (MFS) profile domain-containing protein n=1 Tax=Vanderwaltozyma polyspora (strain ATCC 22028 / DSM 70294 / BCRC 21397 / CBS 2163 / NBRC 10782 / NRRL Y-8283 / UCD 57-17) TaxID=436907 RepID=A7TLW9_VANPO|nr:uncharacterized protein Kpol_1003p11 [Vanderwaltozyma polyspora DSM 70294]EDO16706.1 hypothetical protein Kpol_1003p11 [Vanderwaltozyma polyspora DSM 70294]